MFHGWCGRFTSSPPVPPRVQLIFAVHGYFTASSPDAEGLCRPEHLVSTRTGRHPTPARRMCRLHEGQNFHSHFLHTNTAEQLWRDELVLWPVRREIRQSVCRRFFSTRAADTEEFFTSVSVPFVVCVRGMVKRKTKTDSICSPGTASC